MRHCESLKASRVADIFHFCAYKVIIIIRVGVTEHGSIHCICQPPINIPLFQGNLRSSRDFQFTQLTSMWTEPTILSLPLFFLTSFPPSLLFIFLLLHPSACYRVSQPPLVCFFLTAIFPLSSVISPHLPSSPMISFACLPPSCAICHLFSHVFGHALLFCLPPLMDVVVTRRAEFNGLLCKLWRVMR